MSNFYTLDEVLEKAPAEALRLLFLTAHYHQPFNFTFEGLANAKATLDKFYNALLRVKDVETTKVEPTAGLIDALCDDLNTPLALTFLHEDVNQLNKAETAEEQKKYKSQLLADAYMLGLLFQEPEVWFKGEQGSDETAEIEAKIQARLEAKKNKDWATADAIRNELKAQGIILEDTPQGTTWKRG